MYSSRYNIYTYILPFFMPQWRLEWVDGSGWVWMMFNAPLSYLRSHIDYNQIFLRKGLSLLGFCV